MVCCEVCARRKAMMKKYYAENKAKLRDKARRRYRAKRQLQMAEQ